MRAHWIAITSVLVVACDDTSSPPPSSSPDSGVADAAVDPADGALDPPDANVDPSVPTVVSIEPAADAIDVEPDGVIAVTFSTDMAPATIDATTFVVEAGGAPIAGTVTYASRVATFHPQRRLALRGAYRATVRRDVTDAAGTPLAAERTWSFAVRDGAWDAAGLVLAGDDGAARTRGGAVGIDAAGNATILFEHAGDVDAVRFDAATGWGAATRLAEPAEAPSLAVDDDGAALAVWRGGPAPDSISLFASAYTASWSAPMAVEDDDAYAHHVGYLPHVTVDPTGGMVAIWDQYDATGKEQIWVRRATPDAGWGAPVHLGAGVNPWVVVDPAGNATAAWMHPDNPDVYGYSIWASHAVAGGAWSEGAAIETEAGPSSRVRLAVDDDGDVTAVWDQAQSIWTSRYDPASGWGTAIALEDGRGFAGQPEVAARPDGSVLAVWYQLDTVVRVWARMYLPESGWGTPIELGLGASPVVGFDRAGHAIVLWSQGGDIWARRYVTGLGWGTQVDIDTDDDGESGSPRLAVGASGSAVAVWDRSVGPSMSGVPSRAWRAVFR